MLIIKTNFISHSFIKMYSLVNIVLSLSNVLENVHLFNNILYYVIYFYILLFHCSINNYIIFFKLILSTYVLRINFQSK